MQIFKVIYSLVISSPSIQQMPFYSSALGIQASAIYTCIYHNSNWLCLLSSGKKKTNWKKSFLVFLNKSYKPGIHWWYFIHFQWNSYIFRDFLLSQGLWQSCATGGAVLTHLCFCVEVLIPLSSITKLLPQHPTTSSGERLLHNDTKHTVHKCVVREHWQ